VVSVCHITTAHPSHDARIFHKECRTLARAGYSVTLIAQHAGRETVDDVRIEPLPRADGRVDRLRRLQWRALQLAARERADVYHVHDAELLPLALIMATVWRKRVVYDMHELNSQDLTARMTRGREAMSRALELALEGPTLRAFDLVVFATQSLGEAVATAAPSVTLNNFPSLEDGERVRRAIDWSDKEFDVLHMGSVTPPRMSFMLDVARATAARHPDLRWLFLGVPPATARWVADNYDASFLDRHIVLRGKVPHVEALEYVQRTRIGFSYHPPLRRFEIALPMKVLEYMLMEIPVVTTAMLELRRYLEDGEDAVLVDSQQAADYATAVASLLGDPSRARRIGRQGRDTVTERVNWERSEAPKLLEAYQRVGQG
jgi:glycosyltransferase involved in cell wall biosynthesis